MKKIWSVLSLCGAMIPYTTVQGIDVTTVQNRFINKVSTEPTQKEALSKPTLYHAQQSSSPRVLLITPRLLQETKEDIKEDLKETEKTISRNVDHSFLDRFEDLRRQYPPEKYTRTQKIKHIFENLRYRYISDKSISELTSEVTQRFGELIWLFGKMYFYILRSKNICTQAAESASNSLSITGLLSASVKYLSSRYGSLIQVSTDMGMSGAMLWGLASTFYGVGSTLNSCVIQPTIRGIVNGTTDFLRVVASKDPILRALTLPPAAYRELFNTQKFSDMSSLLLKSTRMLLIGTAVGAGLFMLYKAHTEGLLSLDTLALEKLRTSWTDSLTSLSSLVRHFSFSSSASGTWQTLKAFISSTDSIRKIDLQLNLIIEKMMDQLISFIDLFKDPESTPGFVQGMLQGVKDLKDKIGLSLSNIDILPHSLSHLLNPITDVVSGGAKLVSKCMDGVLDSAQDISQTAENFQSGNLTNAGLSSLRSIPRLMKNAAAIKQAELQVFGA